MNCYSMNLRNSDQKMSINVRRSDLFYPWPIGKIDNRQFAAGATLGSGLWKWDDSNWPGHLINIEHLYYTDGIPYICGGNTQSKKNCFRYIPNNDTWAKSVDLKYGHYKSGYTSHSTLGLVICGQESGNTDEEKCETTLDGNVMQVATEPGLRIEVNFACH